MEMEYGVILVKDKRSQEDKNRADHELIIKALETILTELTGLDKGESLSKDDTISIARSVIKLTDYALQLSNGQIPGVSDEEHYFDLLDKIHLLISNEVFRNEIAKLAAQNETCADCRKFIPVIDELFLAYLAVARAKKQRNLAKYMENKNYKGNNNDYKN